MGHDLILAPGLLDPVGDDRHARSRLELSGQATVPVMAGGAGRIGDNDEALAGEFLLQLSEALLQVVTRQDVMRAKNKLRRHGVME